MAQLSKAVVGAPFLVSVLVILDARLAVAQAVKVVNEHQVARTYHELHVEGLSVLKAEHTDGLCFSSDGKWLASADGEPAVKLWTTSKKQLVFVGRHTSESTRWCRAVAFTPDGSVLASGDDSGTIKLWDVAGRTCLETLPGGDSDTAGLAFAPSGKILYHACRDGIRTWDLAARSQTTFAKNQTDNLSCLALSRDGRLLAAGNSDGAITLWDAATGKEVRTLAAHGKRVRSVAFSPDGKALASGAWDKVAKLWDVATGKERFILMGHPGQVMAVAFSPDGQLLATASRGGSVKLWDVGTGQGIVDLKTGGLSLAFSPDGISLATGAGDGPIRIWAINKKQ
jgi:WD40 repeat protein